MATTALAGRDPETSFPYNLLQTKLYAPRLRPFLVPRPHLINRLNQGLQGGHKLTFISAPAGFGKTTLVSEWVGHLRSDGTNGSQIANRTAWLSLDESDNDPARFLAYFVSALNQVEGLEATIGQKALGMLQTPRPPPTEHILTSLINEIATISDSVVLVLDDYHNIDSAPIDDALTSCLNTCRHHCIWSSPPVMTRSCLCPVCAPGAN